MHFLVLRKKQVSYFANIERGVTIIFKYEIVLQLMTTSNALFVKGKKKITIDFRNLFDTAIGLRVLEMAF